MSFAVTERLRPDKSPLSGQPALTLGAPLTISRSFCSHFRCPERYGSFDAEGPFSGEAEYFEFEREVLFGRHANKGSHGTSNLVASKHNTIPFNIDEIVENLRFEKYVGPTVQRHPTKSLAGQAYYLVRPLLSVKIRRHLQKARLSNWRDLKFPRWPVDLTVDHLMNELMLRACRRHGVAKVPFIWFWPDGAAGAAILTHDVETHVGRDACTALMDIDDSFGFKASFEVVPEKRYNVTSSYLESIRKRGFEVTVHDLNHDGYLFRDYETFSKRAAQINSYGKRFAAEGFRAAVLYRNQEWYSALDFCYDSSVPNVGHLDPQRGGCCTVMPYFIGQLVELPVTLTQDYSLFHILNHYSIDLWKEQIDLVLANHGLINVIIHPDYSISKPERAVFEALLSHMAKMRNESAVWAALPKDVAQWWKQRSEMRLVETAEGWRIDGKGKERARIAYASERGGELAIELSSPLVQGHEKGRTRIPSGVPN